MADKIVQLIDDQNNNIYPISRGLATNSVDTNAIQDGAVTSDKIDSATYSTSEQVVGTWINGKPLYRTIVSFGKLGDNAPKNAPIGVRDIDTIVKIEGYATPGIWEFVSIPYATSTKTVGVTADRTTLYASVVGNFSSYDAYFTVYYTKTTD